MGPLELIFPNEIHVLPTAISYAVAVLCKSEIISSPSFIAYKVQQADRYKSGTF
jgi:hypothetical protein